MGPHYPSFRASVALHTTNNRGVNTVTGLASPVAIQHAPEAFNHAPFYVTTMWHKRNTPLPHPADSPRYAHQYDVQDLSLNSGDHVTPAVDVARAPWKSHCPTDKLDSLDRPKLKTEEKVFLGALAAALPRKTPLKTIVCRQLAQQKCDIPVEVINYECSRIDLNRAEQQLVVAHAINYPQHSAHEAMQHLAQKGLDCATPKISSAWDKYGLSTTERRIAAKRSLEGMTRSETGSVVRDPSLDSGNHVTPAVDTARTPRKSNDPTGKVEGWLLPKTTQEEKVISSAAVAALSQPQPALPHSIRQVQRQLTQRGRNIPPAQILYNCSWMLLQRARSKLLAAHVIKYPQHSVPDAIQDLAQKQHHIPRHLVSDTWNRVYSHSLDERVIAAKRRFEGSIGSETVPSKSSRLSLQSD